MAGAMNIRPQELSFMTFDAAGMFSRSADEAVD